MMITGISQIFINLIYIIGILILLIFIIGLIGVLKEFTKGIFLRNKAKSIYKKLSKIEKKTNEILKDFNRGANFLGLSKVMALTDDIEEIDKLFKESQKKKD